MKIPRCFPAPARLTCTAVALSLMAAAPSFGAVGESVDSELVNEAIVRQAYANLERFTHFAEPGFSVSVDNIYHIDREDFDTTFWLDIVTMPHGLLVEMDRVTKHNQNIDQRRVVYRPSLKYEFSSTSSTDPFQVSGITVQDALDKMSTAEPDNHLIAATSITAFEVTATLGEDSRTYNAAFFWVPSLKKAGTDTALVVQDNVTQGVEEAALDPYEPLVSTSFLERRSPRDFVKGNPNGGGGSSSCVTQPLTVTQAKSTSAGNGHISGDHWGVSQIEITCSCDQSCISRCTSRVTTSLCQDTGVLTTPLDCHKMSEDFHEGVSSSSSGGASCQAGYICAQKSCIFCSCGLAVSVNVAGASVTFSSAGANWRHTNPFSHTCSPCMQDDSLPGNPGSGSGGGSGSNGGNSGGGTTGGTTGGGTGGSTGGTSGGGSSGGSGSSGGGGGGDGGGIPIYCDGHLFGEASNEEEAAQMIEHCLEDPPVV